MDKGNLLSFRFLSQATFWLLFITFIIPVSVSSLPWPLALYRILFITACHLVNFYACYSLLIPKFFERRKYGVLTIGVVVMLFILTTVRILGETHFNMPLAHAVTKGARVGLIILSEVTIAAFASLLALAASNEENRRHVDSLKREKLESELKFLKGQISPHFLFNSINNIYALVLTNSTSAPSALLKLSELLRYLLYDCSGKVSLKTEVEAIKTYASLFGLRSPKELNVTWNINIPTQPMFIEPMILMPLIENVFKHSGLGIEPDARASIEISVTENSISMNSWNVVGTKIDNPESGGIGMENIARRLEQLFPGEHQFIHGPSDDGFAVRLRMPLV